MSPKKPLVSTIEKRSKEGINDIETRPNMVKEVNNHPIATNKIDTVNKTDKPKVSKSKKDKSIRNKSDKSRSLHKSRSLYKSRSTQGTETEYTVKKLNKSRSISSSVFLIKVPK